MWFGLQQTVYDKSQKINHRKAFESQISVLLRDWLNCSVHQITQTSLQILHGPGLKKYLS